MISEYHKKSLHERRRHCMEMFGMTMRDFVKQQRYSRATVQRLVSEDKTLEEIHEFFNNRRSNRIVRSNKS